MHPSCRTVIEKALALAASFLIAGFPTDTLARSGPPNIVFVLIDDLGWMDLACQGNRLVETPHLDRLAAQGMRFTDAYAAAPVCSPTRAALLTGKSPARLRITNHIPDRPQFTPRDAKLLPAAMLDHLPLPEVTLAERLKAAGYATGFFGKWHLAGHGDPTLYPDRQGFDVNLGGCALGGPPTYFDPYGIPTLPNRRRGEYLPDRLVDEASQFLRAQRDRPFFLCLWTYTVHWPMEAPQALLDKYADRKGRGLNDSRFGAMVEAMDAAIGRLLTELDRLELTRRHAARVHFRQRGLRWRFGQPSAARAKGHLYEGGIRVPLIVRWPGVIQPATTCDVPVISMDFYPTLLEAAGVPRIAAEAPDGESLMPLLKRTGPLARDAIFFHYPNYAWHGSNRLGSAYAPDRTN